MKKHYVLPNNVHDTETDMPEYCMFYDVAEVDAVLKRQAAAAISGMNAATSISSGQVQQAHRLRAESNPEALESERQANAILTERVAELEELVEQLQKAVAFWLPHVPPEENERAERISKDTFLLIGYEGPIEAGAEELGWIKLNELMER